MVENVSGVKRLVGRNRVHRHSSALCLHSTTLVKSLFSFKNEFQGSFLTRLVDYRHPGVKLPTSQMKGALSLLYYFVTAVHLKLGEVADPYAPVWIQLVGEKGESGQIQIKPGYGPQDKFEKDRIYKVVARVADIGRVSEGVR